MDAGCLVCVLSIYKRKIGREDVRMRKRKMFRLVSVILCAVMLFTSESMSYIACAAPLSIKAASLHAEEPEGSMDAPSAETAETPGIQGDSGEEESTVTVKPVDETVTVPGDEEKKPTSSDNEDTEETDDDPADQNPGSENEDSPAPDTPEDYDAPEADESPTDDGSGSEKEEDPVTEEQMPVEEDKEPSGSVSDDSISTNTLESLTPGAELTDFVIVDEGGNVLDETQTVYLDQDKTRKFSVRPTPEDAVYSEVLWASDNSRVSVTDGTVALLPAPDDSVENVSLTATITAQIGEIKKTCKVEFLPLIEDVVIVDQDGNEVTEDGLTIGAGLEDLGKGLRSQVGTMYGTKYKGVRYLEMAEGYVLALALDKNNEVCGYKFVSLGKMTDFIKKGLNPTEAYDKAIGTYGRYSKESGAVKYIDPRTDKEVEE